MSPKTKIEHFDDQDLAQACAKRPIDEEAWREFWRRFYPLVYRKVVNLLRPFREQPEHSDVDDIVQLVFLKIFNNLPKYNADKSPLGAYLHMITTHTLFDQLRAGKGKHKIPLEEVESIAYEDEIRAEELWEVVVKALNQLDDPRKKAIVQAFISGENARDICDTYSISPSYLSTIIYRFRKALKGSLTRKK
jgi:RNA polymerase sigma factor (sigma-70 family)